MTVEISEATKYPSDDPANVEVKKHRRAYLVSFDIQLLVDRIVLLEERVWNAQRAMDVFMNYATKKRGNNEKTSEKSVDKRIKK